MLFSRFRFGVAITSVPLCGSSLEGFRFRNAGATLVVTPQANGLSCGESVFCVAMAKNSQCHKTKVTGARTRSRSLFLGEPEKIAGLTPKRQFLLKRPDLTKISNSTLRLPFQEANWSYEKLGEELGSEHLRRT
jgi:hypothetical protein